MSSSSDLSGDADSEHGALISLMYQHFFNRGASQAELEHWQKASKGLSSAEVFRRFAESPAYRRVRGVRTFWAPGHYYSPVVDPDTLGDYVDRSRQQAPEALHGIFIDTDAMMALYETHAATLAKLILPAAKVTDRRYSVEGGPFPAGDAASLYLMMAEKRPRRIVEIGSGYSTAAMLDFAEILGLDEISLCCVEPYPERLRSLMRPGDENRLKLIERPVQQLSAEELVTDLQAGDFLFIDSTHVLKTGSDVHHELFHLLPKINIGVIIHFHDCRYPFEYPDEWIRERNYSWNEIYALRAFLTFNEKFKILYWASMLRSMHAQRLAREVPHYAINPGGSIWLRRTA
jgi:hypothetical protein